MADDDDKSDKYLIWVITGLAIILIIVFIIAMVAFFLVADSTPMHSIIIINKCPQTINLIVGDQTQSLTKKLASGEETTYYATPGVFLSIKGYYDGTDTRALTKTFIWFGNNNYAGTYQISDGNTILTTTRSQNSLSGNQDLYDISIQDGFNLPITIMSNNFQGQNPLDPFVCKGPFWNYNLLNICPENLRLGTGACASACIANGSSIAENLYCCQGTGLCGITGGCQNVWPNIDYYYLFDYACPNCMITNCDLPKYRCQSQDGLTSYRITFSELFTEHG